MRVLNYSAVHNTGFAMYVQSSQHTNTVNGFWSFYYAARRFSLKTLLFYE